MRVGDLRPVDIPILACPECGMYYRLEVPMLVFDNEPPRWIYTSQCKHKPAPQRADANTFEYARLNVARIAPVRVTKQEDARSGKAS